MNVTARTFALFATLSLLFVAVGYLIGSLTGNVFYIIILFLTFSFILNILSYLFGAKLILWSYHAKIIHEADNPKLFNIIRTLATKANIPMPKVAIIPTTVPNAFATGRNKKHAVIAVTEGLLNIMNDTEVAGVIGHELGHIRNKDMIIMTVAATIVGTFTLLARVYVFQTLFDGEGRRDNSLLILIILILAAIGAMLLQLAISRQREYHADHFSAKLSGDPLSLVSALRKIEASVSATPLKHGNPATASLFIINPFKGKKLISLFSTHPPTALRIERLLEYAKKLKF